MRSRARPRHTYPSVHSTGAPGQDVHKLLCCSQLGDAVAALLRPAQHSLHGGLFGQQAEALLHVRCLQRASVRMGRCLCNQQQQPRGSKALQEGWQ